MLLAALKNPQPSNRIFDPTCGSGFLWIKVAQKIGSNNFVMYCQEVNRSIYALVRRNIFLHGMNDVDIRWGDTLNNPLLQEGYLPMKYDIVEANPSPSAANESRGKVGVVVPNGVLFKGAAKGKIRQQLI